jgi:DNA-binding NarL/FixJ family response regulator
VIDVIVADHHEIFQLGIQSVLAVASDIRIVGQPQSVEQLLHTLKKVKPHVLILSTSFLPMLPKIQPLLESSQMALLMLAEDDDRIAYLRWLRAQGVVYRSADGPVIVDAMRRVARGELFVQTRSSDMSKDAPEVG